MDTKIIQDVFMLNIFTILLFSFIYWSIDPSNFEASNPKDKLTYIDFLFLAVTIQSGIGLPDISVSSDLSKILAIIQQLILMGSAFILITFFFTHKHK